MKGLFAVLILSLGAVAAHASPLDGKVLQCSTDDSFLGPVTTQYVFLTDNSNQVLIRSSYFGDSVANYKLNGSNISIQNPFTSDARSFIKANVANQDAITTSYSICIAPGQQGGDSRPVCGAIVESCHF